jgi:hypothetical protein
VGDFLAYCFIDRNFNLPEADVNAMVESTPESVRPLARFWINVYLCWLLKQEVIAKQGEHFFAEALEAAKTRLALGGAATADLAEGLTWWFNNLDNAAASASETQPVAGVPVPIELFAAWVFLALTSESPFFKQRDIPDEIALDVAQTLERARGAASNVITLLAEVGGPLDSEASHGQRDA